MAIAAEIQRAMQDSSWIRRMFELGIALRQERGAENVFDLSLGNPITEPPPQFFDELRNYAAAAAAGAHRYMPNAGYVETRQAVADALSDETGLAYGAEHIVMTVGAAAALNVVVHSLCDRDDEVVILTPFFAEYLFYATSHAAKPVVVGCDADFMPDLEDLASKLSARTKVVIVNSPNNPSGAMYPASLIERWGNCCGTSRRSLARTFSSSATSLIARSSSTSTPIHFRSLPMTERSPSPHTRKTSRCRATGSATSPCIPTTPARSMGVS